MMFGQYCRIESKAGGVWATRRQMIRAARTLLAPRGKSREQRDARHAWLREMLAMHFDAQVEYMSVMSGRRRKSNV